MGIFGPHPGGSYGVRGGLSFLVEGKGRLWTQISHRKLKNSISRGVVILASEPDTMLTPNTPLIHTSFTYSKLNMDDLSVLTGLDKTQEVELKSLHAQTWSFLLLNFVIWNKNLLFFDVNQ